MHIYFSGMFILHVNKFLNPLSIQMSLKIVFYKRTPFFFDTTNRWSFQTCHLWFRIFLSGIPIIWNQVHYKSTSLFSSSFFWSLQNNFTNQIFMSLAKIYGGYAVERAIIFRVSSTRIFLFTILFILRPFYPSSFSLLRFVTFFYDYYVDNVHIMSNIEEKTDQKKTFDMTRPYFFKLTILETFIVSLEFIYLINSR